MNLSHMIVSSLIHGLIYSSIWKVLRGLPTPVAIVVAAAGVVVVATVAKVFGTRSSSHHH